MLSLQKAIIWTRDGSSAGFWHVREYPFAIKRAKNPYQATYRIKNRWYVCVDYTRGEVFSIQQMLNCKEWFEDSPLLNHYPSAQIYYKTRGQALDALEMALLSKSLTC